MFYTPLLFVLCVLSSFPVIHLAHHPKNILLNRSCFLFQNQMIRRLHSQQSQFSLCICRDHCIVFSHQFFEPFYEPVFFACQYSFHLHLLFCFVALSCGKVRDNLTHYALFEVFILFYLSGCNIPFIHIITSIRFFVYLLRAKLFICIFVGF